MLPFADCPTHLAGALITALINFWIPMEIDLSPLTDFFQRGQNRTAIVKLSAV